LPIIWNCAIYAAMKIDVRLTKLLEERERTIYWLAKQVGIDFTALYRMRDGTAKGIKFDLLARICEALECQPSDLLVLVEERPGSKGSKRKVKANG
jgi:putative transcriptional regulator